MNKNNLANYFNSNISALHETRSALFQTKFNPKDYTSKGLTEEEVAKLKETFDTFDIDKSGFISVSKLRAAFKTHANLTAEKETIYHLICSFDQDENGELQFDDFIRIASPITKQVVSGTIKRQKSNKANFQ